MYDAIIVGARCAGSPTALLLARRGYKVLLVDRSRFPSDMSFSNHFLHQAGSACLQRWGLLQKLAATGCPPIAENYFDYGAFSLTGPVPPADGVNTAFAPRRIVLDPLLVEAAVEAGAELREGFSVQDLIWDKDQVVGIRGRQDGLAVTEKARIVIGADGMFSVVAKAVQAPEYRNSLPLEGSWYAYWSGVPMKGWHLWLRPDRVIFAYNTNHNLTLIGVAFAARDLPAIRGNVERNYSEVIAQHAPDLAERMRNGRRESRFVGGAIPYHVRRPHGPGWALVGDAGYQKDPCTASGITDAFRSAEWLAEAIDAGFSGRQPVEQALAAYEERRNRSEMPYFELTTQLAALAPPPEETRQLLAALRHNPEQRSRFFGVLSHSVPVEDFFAPENVQKIMAGAAAVV
ncbi:MAG TPA: NAD(P)/FAD-dependent oxidoreductase [Candidatus Solibacter sp.]|jgi:flavin-dependent dehydrogenase|nr:NAD(P)/FAD-dependent oxidoreductase [Candidatus Solibacter sp.]